MTGCTLCPRACGVDRDKKLGFCRETNTLRLARAALHYGEEPCLDPQQKGSGAVFFSGCSLGCVFCQNAVISGKDAFGIEVSEGRLCEIFRSLLSRGAANLDLVTGTHFTPAIARVLHKMKKEISVPVIWNSSGYESVETLSLLEGLVDVYLVDFKFASSELSAELANAPDYPLVAERAVSEMARQTGACVFDKEGKLVRGVLLRHLVLPNHSADSLAVLELLSRLFPQKESVRLSLMRQYTPIATCPLPRLRRSLTTLEYRRVASFAEQLGFLGYEQGARSVGEEEIPSFQGEGVL